MQSKVSESKDTDGYKRREIKQYSEVINQRDPNTRVVRIRTPLIASNRKTLG